ncbi:MAG: hypothetical protein DSZ00_01825 [Gammaproteobacteria bacterium]|nr:MAG: hypothetical protein DSZ00_01825 [Gammaproteobacteria bacterium]
MRPPFETITPGEYLGPQYSVAAVGNAITELLGVVVKRVPDAEAYEKAEPELVEKLLEVRRRLIWADLGEGIATPHWGAE